MHKFWLKTLVAWSILILAMMITAPTAKANEPWVVEANQHYTKQQWQASVVAHQKWLEKAPDNEQAKYRLAQSYIHLNQGEQALKVNHQLQSAAQIPPAMVLYQKALGLNLLKRTDAMWTALHSAIAAGYRNNNELVNNDLWQAYRDTERFAEVLTMVDRNINPCMHDDKYRQFDFWLGRWEVYGNAEKTGPMFGRNTISRTEQGCLIMEQWQGASGSTGTSMNYYDGILGQWVQRWVSGGGTVIDYTGGLIDLPENKQAMQLVGKIYYAAKNQQPQIRDFRGTWTPLEGGTVQQFFEESIDGGQTWNVWFNGFYFPLKEDEKNES